MENSVKPLFKTIYGIFKDNVIAWKGMDEVECVSYNSLRKQIEGIPGFHHLVYNKSLGRWIVFQYVPFSQEEYDLLMNDVKE